MEEVSCYLEKGEERTRVCLSARHIGEDLAVYIYNENAHLGAVAVSQFDHLTGRVSTSVITLLGHKDDAVAQQAAYLIAKHTRRPVCVIAGIHVDNITQDEIAEILRNANSVVEEFISSQTSN